MLLRQLLDSETGTYTYLIADLATKEAVLVDPVIEQVDRDVKWLKELELTLKFCQVHQATQTLVDAVKGLAQANIQSATDLTKEAHQGIEKSLQMLRDEADRSWQSVIHQVEDIDDRMTKAAKAAWKELTASLSDS
jgi:transcription initiation factor IIF auxiliary subunit